MTAPAREPLPNIEDWAASKAHDAGEPEQAALPCFYTD